MSKKKNNKPKHDEVIRAAFENPIVTQEFFETYLTATYQNFTFF
ncbi:hypothetical protein O6R16_08095 [Candidatus Rickettsia tasmanensis]